MVAESFILEVSTVMKSNDDILLEKIEGKRKRKEHHVPEESMYAFF
jgi:hypothetical protein